MKVDFGTTFKIYTYSGPSDSVSLLYGSGTDLCGYFQYVLTDSEGLPFYYKVVSMLVEYTLTPDQVLFNVYSESGLTNYQTVVENGHLTVSLIDYPLATQVV